MSCFNLNSTPCVHFPADPNIDISPITDTLAIMGNLSSTLARTGCYKLGQKLMTDNSILRYATSYQCQAFSLSNNCPLFMPKLCQSTCYSFKASVQQLLNNTEYCSSDRWVGLKRQPFLDQIEAVCQSSPITDCISGAELDIKTCGFGDSATSKGAKQSYCLKNPADLCCAQRLDVPSTSESGTGDKPDITKISQPTQFSMAAIPMIVWALVAVITLVILYVALNRLPIKERLVKYFQKSKRKSINLAKRFSKLQSNEKSFDEPTFKEAHLAIEKAYNGPPPNGTKVDFRAIVIAKYLSNNFDELNLQVGDHVTVSYTYPDGWAYGILGKKEGMFPLVCVEEILSPTV